MVVGGSIFLVHNLWKCILHFPGIAFQDSSLFFMQIDHQISFSLDNRTLERNQFTSSKLKHLIDQSALSISISFCKTGIGYGIGQKFFLGFSIRRCFRKIQWTFLANPIPLLTRYYAQNCWLLTFFFMWIHNYWIICQKLWAQVIANKKE